MQVHPFKHVAECTLGEVSVNYAALYHDSDLVLAIHRGEVGGGCSRENTPIIMPRNLEISGISLSYGAARQSSLAEGLRPDARWHISQYTRSALNSHLRLFLSSSTESRRRLRAMQRQRGVELQ